MQQLGDSVAAQDEHVSLPAMTRERVHGWGSYVTQVYDALRGLTDLMMDRINGLLDPPYRYAQGGEEARGAARFL